MPLKLTARSRSIALAVALAAACITVVALAGARVPMSATFVDDFKIGVLALGAAACGYLVWHADPAYALTGGILLSPLSGNWRQLGISGSIAPDRVLIVAGIIAILVRAPGARDRPKLKLRYLHGLLAVVIVYAVISAAVGGTIGHQQSAFRLLESFGLLPFLVFLVAPVAFRTRRQRNILLTGLVGLGAYLALTTLFETAHLDALVWPRYILDPNVGIHFSRGRGPFVDAVANGFGLYTCAIAAAIAWMQWGGRRVARPLAGCVVLACMLGAFLSVERSVWIGVALATLTVLPFAGGLRRKVAIGIAAGAVAMAAAALLIPGLAQQVSQRANDQASVWDRQNLDTAALNMIKARPLAGFGWDTFAARSGPYFRQSPNYPLTANLGTDLHSVFLTYAVGLGLIGATLWLAGVLGGLGGALLSRGPPDLRAWRCGLAALAICWAIVSAFVPPSVFPNLALWLWMGVVWSGRYAGRDELRRQAPPVAASPPQWTDSVSQPEQRELTPA